VDIQLESVVDCSQKEVRGLISTHLNIGLALCTTSVMFLTLASLGNIANVCVGSKVYSI
jgi:hypothetical protein